MSIQERQDGSQRKTLADKKRQWKTKSNWIKDNYMEKQTWQGKEDIKRKEWVKMLGHPAIVTMNSHCNGVFTV